MYKTRWDIEKIFDEVKNKWFEKKSWASSDTAKTAQALFVCLTHNLCLLLEDKLKEEEDVFDYEEVRRREKRVNLIGRKTNNQKAVPSTWRGLTRLSQRGVRFIRWLRNNLFIGTSWGAAVEALRRRYALK